MAWEPGLGRVLDSMPSHATCANSRIFVGLSQQGVTGLVDDLSTIAWESGLGRVLDSMLPRNLHELLSLLGMAMAVAMVVVKCRGRIRNPSGSNPGKGFRKAKALPLLSVDVLE